MGAFGFIEDETGLCENAGHLGGDVQVSEAMSRRFKRGLENGTFVVLDFNCYLASETTDSDDEEPTHVQLQVGYTVCYDASDPGMTEISADYRYWESDGTTLDDVRARITNLTAEDIGEAINQMGV